MPDLSKIRNFCIIAHIDHGKSTLADRLLERTGTITEREMKEQTLDDMDLERERGITIKSHAVRMTHTADRTDYTLNLIDTPGHVDFTYEVSRALKACEGAILLVDASQGIEAQTISNLWLALEQDLEIIPVINKVDLPVARPDEVAQALEDLIGEPAEDILQISAKTGEGVDEMLDMLIDRIPPPSGDPEAPLRALIFDSIYDSYRGSVVYARLFDGTLDKGDTMKFMATDKTYDAEELGILRMGRQKVETLTAGDVGYVIGSVKDIQDTRVGDTITLADNPATEPIPGFEEVKPMVFSGIYPTDTDDFEELRGALEKLALNDASLTYEPESSAALGFGFRVGFLGLLHMEIIQERLEREFDLDLITTVPNVEYHVEVKDQDDYVMVDSPEDMPHYGDIETVYEPYVEADIITPSDYIGNIIQLCEDRRGEYGNQRWLDSQTVKLEYELPLAEIVFDFYDNLKSVSRGYASFDYEFVEYRESDLVKLTILINEEPADPLSTIVHRDKAYEVGRKLAKKLKDVIPKQLFEVPVQASIGRRIVARETIKARRKDVTAKCYGGDVSRKKKLLEEQKKGKKRMKQMGEIDVPQEAFLAILSMDEDD
ncbi:elongation factor 4 [Salinibacter sp. 10B]|uniref:translation elongation factor 4 n=1 Tax=Salinibacter sp. 10B TaxID=1923971 RepID=UPI000CF3B337|nr:translation elongation factor 4 [Salinibacter sp. 10B]PQJ35579.1 elongation factor 4 [Salinibacter sp. 10B]